MEKDIIIIAEGGCMLGVFGAGVVTAFEEAKISERVHSAYGSSAGAYNIAYFLCDRARLGSKIYYEELTNGFIKTGNSLKYLKDLLLHRFARNGITNIIDMDYVNEVNLKKLDIEKIKKHSANFYVRVFDIEELKSKYIDAKEDVLTALKASSSSSPYYAPHVEINSKKYIDGSVISTRDFLGIVERNPDKKIIFIFNERYSKIRNLFAFPFLFMESLMLGILYGRKVMIKSLALKLKYPDAKELLRYPNVQVIASEKRYSKICTDREKLLDLYKHGIEKGEEFLESILKVQND